MGKGDDELEEIASLRREELRFLASLTRRAQQSVIQDSKLDDLRTPGRRRKPKKVQIACLAFRIPMSKSCVCRGDPHGPIAEYLDSGKDRYHYVELDPEHPNVDLNCERILDFTKHFLEDVCLEKDLEPNYVLLNELSLCYRNRDDVESRWENLAKVHKIYIVPGTFHDTETYFSAAKIFTPRGRNRTVAKQNTALRQGENIRTPDVRRFKFFSTDFGNVIIWICLDLYDPGLVLKFLSSTNRFSQERGRETSPNNEVHVVLIPSFNKDSIENLEGSVRSLSRFSKTVIACSNSWYEAGVGNPRLETFGYIVGEQMRRVFDETYHDAKGALYRATVFEFEFDNLLEQQGGPFLADKTLSSPFSAIIDGRAVLRDVPD